MTQFQRRYIVNMIARRLDTFPGYTLIDARHDLRCEVWYAPKQARGVLERVHLPRGEYAAMAHEAYDLATST